MNNNPLISIVTVCYNAATTIEQTILSVINQNYKNYEYIIIDGGSKDGTINTIKKYSDKITYWISEPDKGIYDAMNKGASKASGDFIQFLNAGDWLSDNEILFNIFNNNNYKDKDVIYGDMIIRRSDGVYYAKPEELYLFKYYFPLYHPSTFISKNTFLKYKFDINYKISADFKIFRDIYYDNGKFAYLPIAITNFDGIYGISSSGYAIEIFIERGKITGNIKSLKWKFSYLYFILQLKIKAIIKSILMHINPKYLNRFLQKRIPSNLKKIS